MTVDPKLLEILVCPENKTPVKEADATLIAEVNQRIASEELKERSGATVKEPIDGGLLREDGKILYPIRESIPIMMVEHGIEIQG